MYKFILFLIATWTLNVAHAKTVRYELLISNQKVNMTGQEVDFAITVNGGIPAPTLEFTEGDDAEITVKNNLKSEEASIHWHGILLPPEEDGVAYLNTPPIFPGESRIFKFKIRQHGTYWYHSHTMLQEQKGVYGAFIIHPKKPEIKVDKEAVLILSDWSDENADQIIRNLRKDGDFYLYKKNSVRSIFGAAQVGQLATYFRNEWQRMGGMDLSDVGYDAFFINGKKDSQLLVAHPGEKIRLRLINAAASSYFYISLGNIPMKVISADGVDIEPAQTKEIVMGMAETYDILFTVPEHKNYELRATAQDITGYASTWIGMGPRVPAPTKPKSDLYAPMNHGAHVNSHVKSPSGVSATHEGHDSAQVENSNSSSHHEHTTERPIDHSKMSHSQHLSVNESSGPFLETLTVDDIQAKAPTTLPTKAPLELKLVLGGDMERYVWHINGKAIHEDRDILINEGDVVRFVFINETMMHHPMHLHGHFFRVINQYGERSPLKHTVDVPPMGTRTIEFYANEKGQWMLHCHNLYHMKTGMARVVKYMTYKPSAEVASHEKHDPHLHDHWYQTGALQANSNQAEIRYHLSQTWNEFETRIESKKDDDWNVEGDLFYRRWANNFLNIVGGASVVHKEARGQIGVGYMLPLLIKTGLYVDSKGKTRVDLGKRFQWTSTLFSEIDYIWRQEEDFGSETAASLMYAKQWSWAFGIKYTGKSFGAGLQYQF